MCSGGPSRESSCECERRSDLSLPQALNLVNGKPFRTRSPIRKGRVAKAVLSGKAGSRPLWKSCIWRLQPAPHCRATASSGLKYLRLGPRGRAALAQDLLWALVNSKPFLYNY